jgi:hypothetical protein
MITYFVLWCYLLIQGMAQIHRSSAFSKRRGVTLLSPESHLWRWRCCRTLSRKMSIDLGFSHLREYRRKGGVRRWTKRSHHLVVRSRGRHPMVWPAPGSPLALLRTSSRVGKNRRFGLCFVQFWEYFLCNFLKHKNNRKQELALWHLVNRLVLENA